MTVSNNRTILSVIGAFNLIYRNVCFQTFFIKCLSARIRHLKWSAKRKSSLDATSRPAPTPKKRKPETDAKASVGYLRCFGSCFILTLGGKWEFYFSKTSAKYPQKICVIYIIGAYSCQAVPYHIPMHEMNMWLTRSMLNQNNAALIIPSTPDPVLLCCPTTFLMSPFTH